MATISVKSATASEQEQAIAVLTLAFSTDPVARWAFPDSQQYLRTFPELARAFGGNAFAHGSGYCVEGFFGAALWLPPDVQPLEEEMLTLLQRAVPEQQQPEVFAVLEQMGSYHPSEPHWYLPLIGVDPVCQGQGYGSALMAHALIACDRANQLAYLESSNPRNIPLYQRHGFEILGTIQIGSSPPIFPMLRKPRATELNLPKPKI